MVWCGVTFLGGDWGGGRGKGRGFLSGGGFFFSKEKENRTRAKKMEEVKTHVGSKFFLSSSDLKSMRVGNNKIMFRPSSMMGVRQ